MAIPRLGRRIARPLLKAAISSSEGTAYGGFVLSESAVKAGASPSFGDAGRSACGGKVLPSNSSGAAAASGRADRSATGDFSRDVSFGGSSWRSWAVLPTEAGSKIRSLGRFSSTRALASGGSAMGVKSLDHVVLTVKDIEATCRFYSEVLGMEVVKFGASDGGTRVALGFGEQKINLHQVGKEFEPKAHRATAGSADLCFITDTPLDAMQKHIESSGVSILQGPVGRTGALGAIRSVYFRDPDLNLIEVSNYV